MRTPRPEPPPIEGLQGRVLILESEDTLKSMLASRLDGLGFQVSLAAPGERAPGVIRSDGIDVVVLALERIEEQHLRFVEQVRSQSGAPEVVVLATTGTVPAAVRAIKLGAYDYLMRPCRLVEVETAVRSAAESRRRKGATRIDAILTNLGQGEKLTRREIDIVRALLRGMSNRSIARDLDITEHTVKTHMKNIFAKAGVRSRTEILSLVFRELDIA